MHLQPVGTPSDVLADQRRYLLCPVLTNNMVECNKGQYSQHQSVHTFQFAKVASPWHAHAWSICLQDVFRLGERVRCLVMGMDDNFTRISLSTAELEERDGDIMFDKVGCLSTTAIQGFAACQVNLSRQPCICQGGQKLNAANGP